MKILNKKALHNYHILEHLEAGVVLSGAEVKSIRAGRIDLSESHVRILNGEAFLLNVNIPRYNQASDKEYDATKSRKLLLHKNEINSLIGKTSGKNTTLVPISIYEKNNRYKVEIGLAKSKKEFDKRKIVKERDHQRRIEQELRGPFTADPNAVFKPEERDSLTEHAIGWLAARHIPELPPLEKLQEEVIGEYLMERYVIVPPDPKTP